MCALMLAVILFFCGPAIVAYSNLATCLLEWGYMAVGLTLDLAAPIHLRRFLSCMLNHDIWA